MRYRLVGVHGATNTFVIPRYTRFAYFIRPCCKNAYAQSFPSCKLGLGFMALAKGSCETRNSRTYVTDIIILKFLATYPLSYALRFSNYCAITCFSIFFSYRKCECMCIDAVLRNISRSTPNNQCIVQVMAVRAEPKKLWGGRFTGATDPLMERFNESLPFDKRLWAEDLQV